MDRTLFIVKPHAVERGLVGTFLERFERMGLKILALKSMKSPPEFWQKFYPSDEEWLRNVGSKTAEHYAAHGIDPVTRVGTADILEIGKLVKSWLIDHMTSGISVAVVFAGNEAATKVRIACGRTLPNTAAPGTIRFDFSSDSPGIANEEKRPVYNLVHASDPEERRNGVPAVEYEIGLVFPELC